MHLPHRPEWRGSLIPCPEPQPHHSMKVKSSFQLLSPRKSPATFLLHAAMAVIAAGAIVTHFSGIEGKLHLQAGAPPACLLENLSGPGDGTLPFGVSLVETVIDSYPGTSTPMDFASMLRITSQSGEILAEEKTAMNKVMEYDGWRFYQSGISGDSSTLAVSHDPAGTAITYAGYCLAMIAMLLFFMQKGSRWHARTRRFSIAALAALAGTAAQAAAPATIQRPLAASFGKIYTLWNGRICPLQTMARDVTIKLYGNDSHHGYTPEQVLAGWLFYYDDWMADLSASGASGERLDLARWIGSGAALRIYPYVTAGGTVEWLSLSERRPSQMSLDQWRFMQEGMPQIASLIRRGRNVAADGKISELIEGQRRYAPPGTLPSALSVRLERFYNTRIRLFPVACMLLAVALAGLWAAVSTSRRRLRRWMPRISDVTAAAAFACIGAALAIRSFVGGHLPFANGHETMLSLAVIALAASLAVRRQAVMKSALLLVAALAALVAVMGEKNPQIGHLMPVLASPWLSVHVMLVITSYAGFALMAVISATSLLAGRRNPQTASGCTALCRTILLPSVFLLGAGIMAGAVWANQSWGRYWGWDPKETCALITLLVYALPLHSASLPAFRHDRILSAYLLAAIAAVLFTYFGANYLLPGLHSYA